MSVGYHIRKATTKDCGDISRLIKELAENLKMADQVTLSEDELREDGFGQENGRPFYLCFVAETNKDKTIVGYAMYYFTYSSWVGRTSWMEDLYVTAEYRKKGIGTALWRNVVQDSAANGCSLIEFYTPESNKPAIEYYEKKGATNVSASEGWIVFRMDKQAMLKLIDSGPIKCAT